MLDTITLAMCCEYNNVIMQTEHTVMKSLDLAKFLLASFNTAIVSPFVVSTCTGITRQVTLLAVSKLV